LKKDTTDTVQIRVRLPKDLAYQYTQFKAVRGRNKSLNAIYLTALEMFLSPDEADKKEAAVARRLDRIDRLLKALKKEQSVLAETLALYIRTYLAASLELHEDQRSAAFAQAKRRWNKFLEIIAERVGGGQTLFTDLPERVFLPEDFEANNIEGDSSKKENSPDA
jgi:hypothetical protein